MSSPPSVPSLPPPCFACSFLGVIIYYYYYYLSLSNGKPPPGPSLPEPHAITRVIYSVLLLAVRKKWFLNKRKREHWFGYSVMRMHFPSGRMAQNACFFIFHGRFSVVVLLLRGFCVCSFFGEGGKPPRQTLLKYENKIAKSCIWVLLS